MFAVLPSTVIAPKYTEAPPLVPSPGWDDHPPQGETAGCRRRVTIYRDSIDTPWGFRLQGGQDFNAPLSVKRVFSGSPADGQLTRDDLILDINDQPVDGSSYAEILEKIKSAGSSIVLTIETSHSDSPFDYGLHARSAFDEDQIRYKHAPKQETSPGRYESHQAPPATSYKQSPEEKSRPAANIYNPKVTTQSRYRSARRFQTAAAAAPSGLSDPGWVPKPKMVPIPVRTQPASVEPEPPVSQHRSAQQLTRQPDDIHPPRAQQTAAGGSNAPAWYGSLRSTLTAHPWEVRTARGIQNTIDEDWQPTVQTEARILQQDVSRKEKPQQPQTYKAEIRGLMLARPYYHQGQSTPESEDTLEERIYQSHSQVHSAPETPTVETTGRADYQATQNAQTEGSVPIKIQPSVLFGAGGANRSAQQLTKTQITLRAQPTESKTTYARVQATQEPVVAAPHIHKVQQTISVPNKVSVAQMPAAPQVNLTTQEKVNQPSACFSTQHPATPAKPFSIKDQVYICPEMPGTGENQPHLKSEITKGANPVPDGPSSLKPAPIAVMHFNQESEKQEKIQHIVVEHINQVPHRQAKIPKTPVERFNPVPDRLEQPKANLAEIPRKLGKLSLTPVERFNPTPDRPAKQTRVERFNPTPDKTEQLATAPTFQTLQKVSKTPLEHFNLTSSRPRQLTKVQELHSDVKSQQKPVERFNPTPDRPRQLTKVQELHSNVKSLQKPVERFNPTPDRPVRFPQRQAERFNPTPDRPQKL